MAGHAEPGGRPSRDPGPGTVCRRRRVARRGALPRGADDAVVVGGGPCTPRCAWPVVRPTGPRGPAVVPIVVPGFRSV